MGVRAAYIARRPDRRAFRPYVLRRRRNESARIQRGRGQMLRAETARTLTGQRRLLQPGLLAFAGPDRANHDARSPVRLRAGDTRRTSTPHRSPSAESTSRFRSTGPKLPSLPRDQIWLRKATSSAFRRVDCSPRRTSATAAPASTVTSRATGEWDESPCPGTAPAIENRSLRDQGAGTHSLQPGELPERRVVQLLNAPECARPGGISRRN